MPDYRLLLACVARYAREHRGTELGGRLEEARRVVRRAVRAEASPGRPEGARREPPARRAA